jgi:DNA-binding beta-propeller fold protein YncE
MSVTRRSPLHPCEHPSGLAIDAKGRRLFSVCRNSLMAITDADSGKIVATPPIGSGVDGAGFDPGDNVAFSSNGEGTLTVVKLVNGKYTAVDNVPTERGARTMAVDPKTHRIYLPSAEFGPVPAPTEKQPHPRAPVLPDTFHLVVVGKL